MGAGLKILCGLSNSFDIGAKLVPMYSVVLRIGPKLKLLPTWSIRVIYGHAHIGPLERRGG